MPIIFPVCKFQHHVADYPAAQQRCPRFSGCCTPHCGCQALQVLAAPTAFQTDGLWVCSLADALLVYVTTEGLSQLPLQETDQGPVGQGWPCFPRLAQHLAVWWVCQYYTDIEYIFFYKYVLQICELKLSIRSYFTNTRQHSCPVSTTGFGLVLDMGVMETLKLLLWVVFVDCIGVGLLISTLMWYVCICKYITTACWVSFWLWLFIPCFYSSSEAMLFFYFPGSSATSTC